MPTYKNGTATVITHQGIRMEAGEQVETKEIFESLPVGVTLISIDPRYYPVHYSNRFTGGSGDSGAIAVPAGLQQYKITVFCSGAAVKIEFNGVAANAEVLLAGEGKSYQFLNRIVDSFKIYYLDTGAIAEVSIA